VLTNYENNSLYIINDFLQGIVPFYYRKMMVWFKSRKAKAVEKKQDTIYTRWEQDYNLADQPKMGLFDEYLEMGKLKIQFICTFKEVDSKRFVNM
jgi:hypothetical protein